YFSALDSGGQTVHFPDLAPAQWLIAKVGIDEVLFEDDFEGDQGWVVGAPGDTAISGLWVRVDPISTTGQAETDRTPGNGRLAFITGQGSVGGGNGENDVDNGRTTLTSPVMDLSGGE